MRATLTPDDLKKGDLADPGWHPMEIVDYTEKAAETDGSTNCIFHFKILDGPAKGITASKLFNEKALGFGKSLWKTLNFPFDAVKGYELSTELFARTPGFKLMGYIKRGKSNKGNEFNDIADFKPMAAA
jgi:hypothetical protein